MDLQSRVLDAARRHALLSRGDSVLVGVSGGPDSVALLHLLYDLREELEIRLEVAHLQHGLRGEESREEARFVAAAADRLGLPFHWKEIDLPLMKSRAGKGNLEALARAERYRYFVAVARERGIDKLAVGHTRDDQAETFLMWLLRGSGRKGLGGIARMLRLDPAAMADGRADQRPRLVVIRPLIDISRDEILQYLRERGLEYRSDRSNLDPSYLRNWIRLYLIPRLGERIGPQLARRLAQEAELMRDEEQFLDRVTRERLRDVLDGDRLRRTPLLQSEKALQRRLVRLWIKKTRGSLRGIEFDHVEEALRLIDDGPPQGRFSIPGGWEVVKEYETVRLDKSRRGSRPICYSYPLQLDGETTIAEAGMIIRSRRESRVAGPLPHNEMEALFDLAALPARLSLRNFRPGDRFQPLGMSGHKKVKELFIEKKVPLSVRSILPLLATNDEVLWIPGYGRSEIGKIGPRTKAILRLQAAPGQGSLGADMLI